MFISRIIESVTNYLSEAAMRLFAPSDDAYPMIGVQPFTGEPYDSKMLENW
ncbi:MAG: hypothetical protein AAF208_08795 [Cyanobacteria bacterium P01_A01_bin.45]